MRVYTSCLVGEAAQRLAPLRRSHFRLTKGPLRITTRALSCPASANPALGKISGDANVLNESLWSIVYLVTVQARGLAI
jgi:hypothetical protein